MSTTLSSFSKRSRRLSGQGFSLIEMLVVISILSILSVLVSAGLQSITGTTEDGQISDIASTLARARAYAMANNTYVFVGIQEVLVTNPSTGTQTAPAAGSVGGRIGVTVVASNDGTRIYSNSAPSALTASSLTVVSPLRHYDNLHITPNPVNSSLPNAFQTSGIYTSSSYDLALPSNASGLTSGLTYENSSTSLTTFQWPLTGTAQYSFGTNTQSPGTVIQFNPQGQAQIVSSAFTDSVYQWIEIDLAPTHGTTVTASNPATILIDGPSGSVTTYRE